MLWGFSRDFFAVKGVRPFPSWAPNDLHRALWKRILAIGHPTYYQMWWRYSLTKKRWVGLAGFVALFSTSEFKVMLCNVLFMNIGGEYVFNTFLLFNRLQQIRSFWWFGFKTVDFWSSSVFFSGSSHLIQRHPQGHNLMCDRNLKLLTVSQPSGFSSAFFWSGFWDSKCWNILSMALNLF